MVEGTFTFRRCVKVVTMTGTVDRILRLNTTSTGATNFVVVGIGGISTVLLIGDSYGNFENSRECHGSVEFQRLDELSEHGSLNGVVNQISTDFETVRPRRLSLDWAIGKAYWRAGRRVDASLRPICSPTTLRDLVVTIGGGHLDDQHLPDRLHHQRARFRTALPGRRQSKAARRCDARLWRPEAMFLAGHFYDALKFHGRRGGFVVRTLRMRLKWKWIFCRTDYNCRPS